MGRQAEATGSLPRPGEGARLLRKEWIVFSPRHRCFVPGVFLLAAVQTVTADEAYFFLGIALAAALAVYVPVMEWHRKTELLLYSLPVRRADVVLHRYRVAVLSCGMAWIAWTLTGRLLLPLFDAGRTGPALCMTFPGALAFFIAASLLFALFFPFYFRLGLGRGLLAFLPVGLGLSALGYAAAGRGTGQGLLLPGAFLHARVTRLLDTLGTAGGPAVIAIGLALILAASILLSMRAVLRREF